MTIRLPVYTKKNSWGHWLLYDREDMLIAQDLSLHHANAIREALNHEDKELREAFIEVIEKDRDKDRPSDYYMQTWELYERITNDNKSDGS